MKYSLEWLKAYVPIRFSPEALAERLTMAGAEVAAVKKEGDDFILEIEITPNRPDLLSHIGLSREIAAMTGGRVKLPHSALRTQETLLFKFLFKINLDVPATPAASLKRFR